jgi:hypothetical protein
MIADLSIAWLFWLLIRWPIVQEPLGLHACAEVFPVPTREGI